MTEVILSHKLWREMNVLARTYSELQRARVAFGHRILKFEESELVEAGLMKFTKEEKKDTVRNRIIKGVRYEPIDDTEETEDKIREHLARLKETSYIYGKLLENEKKLEKQENDMLKDAASVFESSQIWFWCDRTRGLGQKAALTFLGYINPERSPTLGNIWSMIGLTPDSRLKKGEQGHSNPLVKGMIYVIAQNIIRAQDPYYYRIYALKKQYYYQRPDLLDQKEGPNKIRGWKGKINNYSMRILMKILVSHAYEIIMKEYNDTVDKHRNKFYESNKARHRNMLPIKPESEEEQEKVLESFEKTNERLIQRLEEMWNDKEDENHIRYYEYMRNAELT